MEVTAKRYSLISITGVSFKVDLNTRKPVKMLVFKKNFYPIFFEKSRNGFKIVSEEF